MVQTPKTAYFEFKTNEFEAITEPQLHINDYDLILIDLEQFPKLAELAQKRIELQTKLLVDKTEDNTLESKSDMKSEPIKSNEPVKSDELEEEESEDSDSSGMHFPEFNQSDILLHSIIIDIQNQILMRRSLESLLNLIQNTVVAQVATHVFSIHMMT